MKTIDLRNDQWADLQPRLNRCRQAVYLALLEHGPLTTRQLAEQMQLDLLYIRPRITELVQWGFVRLVDRIKHQGIYEAIPLDQVREALEKAKREQNSAYTPHFL